MTFTGMLDLIKNLQEIAAQADRERLSLWYPQFVAEFPEAAAVIDECTARHDPQEAIKLLRQKIAMFDVALTIMPLRWQVDVTNALTFLHKTLRERKLNEQYQLRA